MFLRQNQLAAAAQANSHRHESLEADAPPPELDLAGLERESIMTAPFLGHGVMM